MKILFSSIVQSSQTNRAWCVFSHFDPNGRVEPYVLEYLAELTRCGFSIVVVSTSASIDGGSIDALKDVATVAILRDNSGYDFGSYKVGIDFIHAQNISADRLLLANDSVYGPFCSLSSIFEQAREYDLFGLTDSFDYHHHLQSYFLLYGNRVMGSPAFREFWDQVELIDSDLPSFKQQIILRYEVGGTQFFLERGFRIGSAFPFVEMLPKAFDAYMDYLREAQTQVGSTVKPLDIKFNATHRFWQTLLEMGCPFLKRELLLLNPTNTDITTWPADVQRKFGFDLTNVITAMRNYSGNDDFFFYTKPANIAELLSDDGEVTLPVNPAMRPWQAKFSVPDSRHFRFDEELYLQRCPDVHVAVIQGKVEGGLWHFRKRGYLEGRPWALVQIPGQETSAS